MAISIYPRRVPTFPTHKNLLDDVDADHVNRIQIELTAVMTELGTNPHIYNDINIPAIDTSAIPQDDGQVVTDETQYSSIVYRFYDPKVNPVDHGTVGQRLDDIERGQNQQVFALAATGLPLTSSPNSWSLPRLIRASKPPTVHDPYAYFDGTGVTLRKSGFWLFTATVGFGLLGTTAAANDGVYQASISWDGHWWDGLARDEISGISASEPVVNPVMMGFFNRGTRVAMRASQNSGITQRIKFLRFSGVLLRETIS